MVPMRGQIIKVHAPWVKTAFYADYDTYILPGFDGVVTLGGTRQYDSYNTQVDKYDTMSIRERCNSLVPSLAKATTVREAVGLRPYRSTVRVETEMIRDLNGQELKIIHNCMCFVLFFFPHSNIKLDINFIHSRWTWRIWSHH